MACRVECSGEAGTWSYVVDLPQAPDGQRRQRKKGGFRTREEAEAALAGLLTDVQKGVVIEPTARPSLPTWRTG